MSIATTLAKYSSLFIMSLLVSIGPLWAAGVTLAWDPASGATGYKVHYGTASRSYTSVVNAGNVSTYTLSGLNPGTYYFSVTATNSSGSESTFSNEASVVLSSSAPLPPPPPSTNSLANSATLISSSQNIDAGYTLDNLWDGCTDASTACTTAARAASFWAEFDLQRDYALTSARLFGDDVDAWYSNTWKLEYKRNASDPWTTGFGNVNAKLNGWSAPTLNVIARYVRVEIFGNASVPATEARELEILGTVSTSSPSLLPAPTNVSVK